MLDQAMKLGVVVIGRNEGERLRRCLTSLTGGGAPVVYVDSGSTDGSVECARSMNAHVVELDRSRPVTAARARNKGFRRLLESDPEIEGVQFVDGDCMLEDGWLQRGRRELETHRKVVIVCGRLREMFPDASIYNRLCDMEWNLGVGETRYCGGTFMIRADAFRFAGQFRSDLVAGEEPELCFRLRRAGWKIVRLCDAMACHDAAMTHFSQWWKRMVRSGYAFAEGAAMHGKSQERYCVRETWSIWLWALLLPGTAVGLAYLTHWLSLALLSGYPLLATKIGRYRRKLGDPWAHAWIYAGFCIIGKSPQLIGQCRFWLRRIFARGHGIVAYKSRMQPTSVGED